MSMPYRFMSSILALGRLSGSDPEENIGLLSKAIVINSDKFTKPTQINQRVRQGCSLSSILFNLYINNITRLGKAKVSGGTVSHWKAVVNTRTLLLADLYALTSENTLRRAMYSTST